MIRSGTARLKSPNLAAIILCIPVGRGSVTLSLERGKKVERERERREGFDGDFN